MKTCKYYTQSEIQKGFPLEKCGSCEDNVQDSEDGFYGCKKMIDNVNDMTYEKKERDN